LAADCRSGCAAQMSADPSFYVRICVESARESAATISGKSKIGENQRQSESNSFRIC
jgi:hypothetical protein